MQTYFGRPSAFWPHRTWYDIVFYATVHLGTKADIRNFNAALLKTLLQLVKLDIDCVRFSDFKISET